MVYPDNTSRNVVHAQDNFLWILTKHARSSTGINAPLFSYLPVCIRNAREPNLTHFLQKIIRAISTVVLLKSVLND